MRFGAVAIGRNEGEHLRRCLIVAIRSVSGSAGLCRFWLDRRIGEWARHHGADVIELDMSLPFTAARARNAGFRRLRKIAPDLPYVQFVDGDCELIAGWPERAVSFLGIASRCWRRLRAATRALP